MWLSKIRVRDTSLFLLTFLSIFTILCIRSYERLMHPQLVAEDGITFFEKAYNLSIHESIFLTYRGGLYVISRLIAEFSLLFDILYVPFIFMLSAVVVQSFCAALFSLKNFSWIIDNTYIRYSVCIIMALLPASSEIHLRLYNTHWYICLMGFILMLAKLESKADSIVYAFMWSMIGLSAPQSIIFIPCLFIRSFCEKRLYNRLSNVFSCAVLVIILIVIFHSNNEKYDVGLNIMNLLVAILNSVSFRVLFVSLFGINNSYSYLYNSEMINIVYVVSTAFVISIGYAIYKNALFNGILIYILYSIISPILLFMLGRSEFVEYGLTLSGLWGDDRYYILSIFALFFLAIYIINKSEKNRIVSMLIFSPMLISVFSDFNVKNVWIKDFQWERQVDRIRYAELFYPKSVVAVPINPSDDWTMYLRMPDKIDNIAYYQITDIDDLGNGYFDEADYIDMNSMSLTDMDIIESDLIYARGWAFSREDLYGGEIIIVDSLTGDIVASTSINQDRPDILQISGGKLVSGWGVVFPSDSLHQGKQTLSAYYLIRSTNEVFLLPGSHTISVSK